MKKQYIIFALLVGNISYCLGQVDNNTADSLSLQTEYYKLINKKGLPRSMILGALIGLPVGAFPTELGNTIYTGLAGASIPFVSFGTLKRARRKAAEQLKIDHETADIWNRSYGEWRKKKKARKKEEREEKRKLKRSQ